MSRITTSSTIIMTEAAVARALDCHREAVEAGKRVRYFRQQSAFSQDEVAAFAGFSQATLSRIERGERAMRPHERAALARALGVSLSALKIVDRPALPASTLRAVA